MTEKEPGNTPLLSGLEKPEFGASDMEIALFFISHLENPCEVEVAPGQIANIRDFYRREILRILPLLSNPFAKEMLEAKIKKLPLSLLRSDSAAKLPCF